jgi:spermidine synthase
VARGLGATGPVAERRRVANHKAGDRNGHGRRLHSRNILDDVSRRGSALPWLILLFVGSGCAALIYEVVWFQLLQIVIGSSALSLGVLLGTFMGGLCLGSLLLPRLVHPAAHPLRVYAALELTIALFGGLLLIAVPLVDDLYALGGGHIAIRLALASACLLPPTMAMGATLPAIARWVDSSPAGVAWLGWFYAGNLAGAVAGTLLAGFYLLRVHDVVVATAVAAALNATVAAAAWAMARRPEPVDGNDVGRRLLARAERTTPDVISVVIALSGATALSAQVVWTRLLSLSLGATVYTFSLILAAFLVGLGLGSALGAALSRRPRVPARVALGWCQILLSVAMVWAAYVLTAVIPSWPISDEIARVPWRLFQHDLLRALIVVLPGALLWGASFPLALASIAAPGEDPGRLAGRVYAANTAGAIAGALGTGLLLVASFGSQRVLQGLIVVAGLSGALALIAPSNPPISSSDHSRGASAPRNGLGVRIVEWTGIAASVALAAMSVLPVPGPLIAFGRRTAEYVATAKVADAGSILYAGEGRHDFIAVSRGPVGQLYYHAAGKVQASTVPEDMRLQLLLAHLSHLVPARPARALVIGCGAGITAGALSTGPGVEHITMAEIEPLVPMVAAAYFGDYNHQILQDPRVFLRLDDGRHVLATTRETFDVITTDLIDPWVKGVAALFTREFFELAKQRLRPGGVVTQFIQLYQSSPAAVQSEIATFLEVFPNAIVWGNPHEGQGYDLVLLGQAEPIRIDVDALQARLESPAYARVRESLGTIGVETAVDLLATYAGSGSDLGPWLRNAAINRDRNLRLQYLAGLGLNLDENAPIYREMLQHSRFPNDIFSGSPATIAALRAAVAERSEW